MTDKHSPGPWRVAGTSVEDLNEAPILQRHAASDISDDMARANAELAAEAPELLKALRAAIARCAACEQYGPLATAPACPDCVRVRALLARIDGEGAP